MQRGWVSINRSITDNWLWEDKPFSKGQAWIDLLLMVNHEDKKVPLGNKLILVKRGSRITSIRQLCDKWGWSNTKVMAFLNMLQQDEMIHYKSDTKKTVVSIVKYSDYQDNETDKTSQKHHKNIAKTSQKHTNNNDNNDNKKEYIHHFETWWNEYPRKVGKASAEKIFNRLKVDDELLEVMLKALEIQKQSKQWQSKEFIPHPSTYLNQRRWEDELEEETTKEGLVAIDEGIFKF